MSHTEAYLRMVPRVILLLLLALRLVSTVESIHTLTQTLNPRLVSPDTSLHLPRLVSTD
jgi:hypothetical protein